MRARIRPEQVAQLAASLREWGWTDSVLVDEGGGVIAGHARLLAAKTDRDYRRSRYGCGGMERGAEARLCSWRNNQLSLNAGWDDDLLRLELQQLKDWQFDTELLGFADIDALLADKTEGLTDPDDAPAAPVNPVTRAGDLWLCGRHRVLCGTRQAWITLRRRSAACSRT